MKRKLIEQLYMQIQQCKRNSKEYSKLLSNLEKQRRNLEGTLNDKEIDELDELIETLNNMTTVESKEFFAEGFIMAIKLMIEVHYN